MKILKTLLFILLGLLGVYAIVCATSSKNMKVSKSIVINASPDAIFEEVVNFEKMQAWSPWAKMDPTTKNTYTGTPGTVGHSNSWSGEKMGKGSQTIIELVPSVSYMSDMKFEMTKDAVHKAGMTLTPEGEATKVTWTYDGADTPFLFRGLMTLMGMEKSLSSDYEAGLKSLKEIAEAKPKAAPISYEIVDIKDSWYLGKNYAAVKMSEVDSSMFGSAYEAVMKAAGDKCSKEDMPFCIARNMDYNKGVMDLEMGMVTTEETKADGLVTGKIPAGRCAKYVYYGPYDGTSSAWTNLMTQIAKDGLKPRWDGYEIYANDPMIVKDPAKFETWLMQPVE